ncbi:MAG: 16S rRNA (guanine527-N7)-methyltransferase [Candidatus Azotimanducaceae bacterium]|jgi:16S rRNA (guanine527-N7)-methyltransferase
MGLEETIRRGLSSLSINAAESLAEPLAAYLSLIVRWNRVTNLTAITEEHEMVTRHLLDSLVIAPHIRGDQILDVGSGAGLPGIPLALLFPDRYFTLLDSNGKKTRFLTQAKIDLGLNNVNVEQYRVEDYEGSYDCIVARAFRSTEAFIESTAHLLSDGGSLLAMKGPSEIPAPAVAGFKQTVHTLDVPGLDADRFLIEIVR